MTEWTAAHPAFTFMIVCTAIIMAGRIIESLLDTVATLVRGHKPMYCSCSAQGVDGEEHAP